VAAVAALAGVAAADRLILMAMQPDRPAEVVGVVLGPEDAAAVCVEHAGVAELVDGPARLEGGIELEERLRPKQAASASSSVRSERIG